MSSEPRVFSMPNIRLYCLAIAATAVLSGLASVSGLEVIVCPISGPRCVTLQQLLSGTQNLNKSNSTFKLEPATFEILSAGGIKFINVSNINFGAVTPHKANISCAGRSFGLTFQNVSRLAFHNIHFHNCFGYWNYVDSISVLGLLESSNIEIENVTITNGESIGLLASNVYGNLTVSNLVFTHKKDSGISLRYFASIKDTWLFKNYGKPTIIISNSFFDTFNDGFDKIIEVLLDQPEFSVVVHMVNVTITNSSIGGICVTSWHPIENHIRLEHYNYYNNFHQLKSSLIGGQDSSDFTYLYRGYSSDSNLSTLIEIISSNFVNNFFKEDKSIDKFREDANYAVLYFEFQNVITPLQVSIRKTSISNNTGSYGPAILLYVPPNKQEKKDTLTFHMIDSNFTANNIFSSNYIKRGAVRLNSVGNITVHNCQFVNNSGTGMLVENSDVHFSGTNNVFSGNEAYNGGGIALYWDSNLYLMENAVIRFENNIAENFGGGMYVKQNEHSQGVIPCFLQVNDFDSISLSFSNNTAQTAGDDLYGGNLHLCESNSFSRINRIIYSSDRPPDVSSDPVHVCDCSTENSCICGKAVKTIRKLYTYPGRAFNLSLVAVGQLLNSSNISGVPSAIFASLLQNSSSKSLGSIPDAMIVQNGQRVCTELTYRVMSTNAMEVMVLTVENNIGKIQNYFASLWQDTEWISDLTSLNAAKLVVPAFVEIHMLHCPGGFEISIGGECICNVHLKSYVTRCSIDTLKIQRKPSVWIATKPQNAKNASVLFQTHKHCPYDYCRPGTFEFNLSDPDAQCDHNRSSTLCGRCKYGYSLMLGRMECRKCSNMYLLLLIPFVLAGILLIVFLSLTDMTVAAGTINGLLFYANIVRENQAIFFPHQAVGSFLSVFIAWLNLDLGIMTCFYDGLDASMFAWLQFAFPAFVWLLAIGIILGSKYSGFINKTCGRNIVPVLATLFLLSYTKFQRTISVGLAFTVVDVSNGDREFVWLKDGNVDFLQGKHIPLFVVSLAFLVILFLPYTLSIMLGPWLQKKNHYKMLFWVLKWKPFFDAYFGPLKDKCRYWTGILLISRVILSLVSSVNVLGDANVNLLAIVALTFVLVILLWQSGGVYKTWVLSVLDSFFLVNLGILATATFYNQLSRGSQYAAIITSTGSVFVVFCLILLYHCIKRLQKCKSDAQETQPLLGGSNNKKDDDFLDAVDAERN